MSLLSDLPDELILHVLFYLPLGSLAALKSLSKSWYDFFAQNQLSIYHQAALFHNFVASIDLSLVEAKRTYDDHLVRDATDWSSFCRRLLQLQKNWAGRGLADLSILPESIPDKRIHRIKVDENVGIVITTHSTGGLKVTDLERNNILWKLPETYVRSWAHCEYGNGFLIFDRFGEYKEVWRLATDYDATKLPSSHLPDQMQRDISSFSADHFSHESPRGHFKPWALLHTPEWGRAFRFVYPILLVASLTRAYLYHVETGQLVQTIENTQEPAGEAGNAILGDINYVELNDNYVFICGTHELRVFSRKNGANVLRLPSDPTPESPCIGLDFSMILSYSRVVVEPAKVRAVETSKESVDSEFIAVHASGSDVAALLSDNRVLLIRDFDRLVKGEKSLAELGLLVDLDLSKDPDNLTWGTGTFGTSAYLAFEHGRVGIVTTTGVFVLILDGTRHGLLDPETSHDPQQQTSLLQHTCFPYLLATHLPHFNRSHLLRHVSCLQMTNSRMFLAYNAGHLMSQWYYRRLNTTIEAQGANSSGEADEGGVGQSDEPVARSSSLSNVTAITTTDMNTNTTAIANVAQPTYQDGDGLDNSDDEFDPLEDHHMDSDDDNSINSNPSDFDDEFDTELHYLVCVDFSPKGD